MASNFLLASGTNGFIATPFNLQTTELNSLANGNTALSSVGGTSGVFSQTNWAKAMFGRIWFEAGGALAPASGAFLSGWFLRSSDGGTTFEKYVANSVQWRSPDFIIPLVYSNGGANDYTSGQLSWQNGTTQMPWESCKVLIRNGSGVALPASGNKIVLGPVAVEF